MRDHLGNNCVVADWDGREKLNGMHDQSKPKDARLIDFRYKRQKTDNGMIHIYAHGSADGFTYTDQSLSMPVRNSKDLTNLLNKKSEIWRTRQKGENIYI